MTDTTQSVAGMEEKSRGENPLDILPAERYGITITLPQPILQKHVEQFQSKMQERVKDQPEQGAALIRGYTAKIGIELGWVSGADVLDISNMHAGKVSWIYAVIAHHIAKAQEIPPN